MSKKESSDENKAISRIASCLDAYRTHIKSLLEDINDYKAISEEYYKLEKAKDTPESVLNTIIMKFKNINYVNLASLQEFFDEKTLNISKNINKNHFEDCDQQLEVMYALYSITLYLYNLSPITESDRFLFNLQNLIKNLNRIAYPMLSLSSVNSKDTDNINLTDIKYHAQECYMNLID